MLVAVAILATLGSAALFYRVTVSRRRSGFNRQ
jgi:hypothetical protein